MVDAKCEACRWWRPNKHTRTGQCRYNPPTFSAWGTGEDNGTIDGWPVTKADEWCRCWTAKKDLVERGTIAEEAALPRNRNLKNE